MRNFLFFSLLISVGLWRVFADMNQPYTAPKYNLAAFHCPYSACGAYAKQKWHHLYYIAANNHYAGDFWGAQCDHCQGWSVWNGDTLVYPPIIGGVAPNPDLPSDIIKDFDEARSIINISPRGAAALLRLCVQKICFHLGEQGKRIDDDIASLVKKGLHPMVQKSLDIVRVVGNEAVHPGQLDLRDDVETANKLFGLVNLIAEVMITQPSHVEKLYMEIVPENKRDAIDKRDGKL